MAESHTDLFLTVLGVINPKLCLTGLKSKCRQGDLREKLFSCLSQFLQAACILWLMVPSLRFHDHLFSLALCTSALSSEWLLSNSDPLGVVVQLLINVRLFVTPWTATCQASLSFTISWSLLKFLSTELVVPSNRLILCHSLLLPSVFPSIRVFSSETALPIRWPKYWSFEHQSIQWIFRVDLYTALPNASY